ncbi:MAG: ribonuclease HI [Clostridiaceae bacterium]|nr:ribonuclease HI [Clostridiaceae bacterium]
MKNVAIYSDGACSGNPGPGGWGSILCWNGIEKELSGGEPETTNNRMELMGAISAFEALKEPCTVDFYTDSQYITKALSEGWLENWKKRGWKKADKSPVLNIDLWQRFDSCITKHDVRVHWVKGHADNPYNNRCDALAVEERLKF